ncbi:hypothetical protein Vafri_4107 [Volvox africanus]|uniref:Uncharacterized protein n=1 Tax=Volvox africanus TaxID=51714 RepID=A0A8J4ASZ0_9CHLO|nr:hypothetical protein Vafri_4107 [Volvox africanus]
MQACIEVSQRYSKVMGPAEQMQLAAAVLPLAGQRADRVVTKRTQKAQAQPSAAAAAPAPAVPGPDTVGSSEMLTDVPAVASGAGPAAAKRSGRRRRWQRAKEAATVTDVK